MFDTLEIFSALTEGDKRNLELFCQTRTLAPGEKLFEEWDIATAMYIVMSGNLKAYRERSTGEVLLGLIGKWDIAGEMAVFGDGVPKTRLASIAAGEAGAVLLVILDTAITELSRKHEELYKKITRIISLRKEENTRKFAL